ncbi:Hypothetical predicted protein [Prunus dulcis]|uniref:RNase H type-1 domain-containing protein n=1 Tax=Prunus dulcis TaxID=3755 RepID=A0A5E4FSJ6_PRUDU|nr:hypothetical protein L3X38_030965 [Prunus dulcis]VVA30377.1 Hypothetical predicted protein [Prunus dulcis]
MGCNFAKEVWGCSSDIRPLTSHTGDLYRWLSSLGCSTPKFDLDLLSKALLICWQIWEARNNMLFQGSKLHPACCIHVVATVGLNYWQLNSSVQKEKDIPMVIKWHPPSTGWIKVNFDGSLMNSQASTGFVILNCDGNVLLAGSNNIGENSINAVESVALRDGLVAAIERDWDQIMVEGDSKLVIDSILKKSKPPLEHPTYYSGYLVPYFLCRLYPFSACVQGGKLQG